MRGKTVKYLIIGAGPTGLGAARTLQTNGEEDFLIIEREQTPGGLARSQVDSSGFTWDIGGHVHFSHYKEYSAMFEEVMQKKGWSSLSRESWIWMKKRFIPYPLQQHLHFLPFVDGVRSLAGMLLARADGVPDNFHAWMKAHFGKPLTELFLYPYNKKVWAHSPEDMDFGWVGERVMVPSAREAVKNFLFRKKTPSWGPNASFLFPKRGGTGSIWNAIAGSLGGEKILYGVKITSVDTVKKELHASDGSTFQFEFLLSTMPIDLLVGMSTPALPREILEAADTLLHSSTHIVGLGIRGEAPESLRHKSWMYFPESGAPFYRATVFSNYSGTHTPDPKKYWSLMTETSSSAAQPLEEKNLVRETIRGAIEAGLLSSDEDIVSVWTFQAPYGYPVPGLGRDEALAIIIPALESKNIYSRGRFGGWKYEVGNQDHSFMQGAEWARRMLAGEEEKTFFYPERVNATGTPKD